MALPHGNPEKTVETLIAGGRYAGLMDFDAKTNMVLVPKHDAVLEDVNVA